MRVLSLPDRLRVVAVELGLTRAPRWMIVAVYDGAAELERAEHPEAPLMGPDRAPRSSGNLARARRPR